MFFIFRTSGKLNWIIHISMIAYRFFSVVVLKLLAL